MYAVCTILYDTDVATRVRKVYENGDHCREGNARGQKYPSHRDARETRGSDLVGDRDSQGNNPVHVEKQEARRLAAQGRIVG